MWSAHWRVVSLGRDTNQELSIRQTIFVRLQLFAWLEANRLARRNRDFLAGARVAADAALARFHHKDAKAAQLDPVATRQCVFHRIEQRVHRLLGF